MIEDEIWDFFNKMSFNASTFIKDNYKNRSLIKVVDILGRESKEMKNQPLFYIYDDGTVEKQIIITY